MKEIPESNRGDEANLCYLSPETSVSTQRRGTNPWKSLERKQNMFYMSFLSSRHQKETLQLTFLVLFIFQSTFWVREKVHRIDPNFCIYTSLMASLNCHFLFHLILWIEFDALNQHHSKVVTSFFFFFKSALETTEIISPFWYISSEKLDYSIRLESFHVIALPQTVVTETYEALFLFARPLPQSNHHPSRVS